MRAAVAAPGAVAADSASSPANRRCPSRRTSSEPPRRGDSTSSTASTRPSSPTRPTARRPGARLRLARRRSGTRSETTPGSPSSTSPSSRGGRTSASAAASEFQLNGFYLEDKTLAPGRSPCATRRPASTDADRDRRPLRQRPAADGRHLDVAGDPRPGLRRPRPPDHPPVRAQAGRRPDGDRERSSSPPSWPTACRPTR